LLVPLRLMAAARMGGRPCATAMAGLLDSERSRTAQGPQSRPALFDLCGAACGLSACCANLLLACPPRNRLGPVAWSHGIPDHATAATNTR
jgi:hypothetical protein